MEFVTFITNQLEILYTLYKFIFISAHYINSCFTVFDRFYVYIIYMVKFHLH